MTKTGPALKDAITGAIPMEEGGTGGTSPSLCRSNMGIHVRSISLPTSYNLSTGIPVDLSEVLNDEIVDIWIMRGSWGGVLFEVIEEGVNTFVNRKCILRVKYPRAAVTPAGTISQPTFVGDIPSASGACILLCTNNHPGLTAPTGTVSQPTFTGTTQAAAVAEEVAEGTNLQNLTGFPSITIGVIGD